MISIRLFRAAPLALFAGMFAVGTANAHMPGVPSVSVRPPSVNVPRPDTSSAVNSAVRGAIPKNGNGSSQKTPAEPQIITMGEWYAKQNADALQKQQGAVDRTFAALNAASAEIKKATLNEDNAAWKIARDKWEDALSKYSKEQQALNTLKEKVAANPRNDHSAGGSDSNSSLGPGLAQQMGFYGMYD
jgi:hypothetical protein